MRISTLILYGGPGRCMPLNPALLVGPTIFFSGIVCDTIEAVGVV